MENKIRTAVCISGLPREADETWRSFYDNLLTQFPNPDVFIYSGEYYSVGGPFFTAVQPKKYKVESQVHLWQAEEVLKKIGYHCNGHLNAYCQQIYGLKKVWELKKEYEDEIGVTYDIVIRTRPDFIMLRPVKPEYLDLTKISTLHPSHAPTICAEFAVGPNKEMEQYFHIYDWLMIHGEGQLTKDHHVLSYAKVWNSDSILTVYLQHFLGYQIGNQDKIPDNFKSPYDYYRIMKIHKRGGYG